MLRQSRAGGTEGIKLPDLSNNYYIYKHTEYGRDYTIYAIRELSAAEQEANFDTLVGAFNVYEEQQKQRNRMIIKYSVYVGVFLILFFVVLYLFI